MRLISFAAKGRSSYGVLTVDDGIVDLGPRLGGRFPTLKDAIAGNAISHEAANGTPDVKLSDVELLRPIPEPEKIIAIGKNYKGHSAADKGGTQPDYPGLFLRLSNTLVAPGKPLVRPKVSAQFDFEGELAVIIGKEGRHIAKQDVHKHIFGYSIFNDGSIRDYQMKHSLSAGKNFDSTGSFGPWIVTADEIPDPSQLMLETRLNGERVQHSKTDLMIFDIPTTLSYISGWTKLVAGDVIATGTPSGVGLNRTPQLWMKAGDTIEVEISGIGTLRNSVIGET